MKTAGKKILYEYNPDLRSKIMSDKIIAPTPIDLPNNERTGSDPSIEDISNLSVSNDNLISVFNEAAFRV